MKRRRIEICSTQRGNDMSQSAEFACTDEELTDLCEVLKLLDTPSDLCLNILDLE